MRPAERLFRIINEMRARPISRAADLAARLEVSVSTVYRDIAHLQASGLPIDGEAGVGYVLRPGFDLPNVAFTPDQIDALAIGLSIVERIGDPALAEAAREARAKLQAGMPRPEDRSLADAPFQSLQRRTRASAEVALLRKAIRHRRIVEFAYADAEGRASSRRVRPLIIWNLADGWMVSAWCELRTDFRTFRLDRMTGLTLSDDIFVPDADTGLKAFLAREACEGEGDKDGSREVTVR